MIPRYIQGVRRFCKKCNTNVTPVMYLDNEDITNITKRIVLKCDKCGSTVGEAVVQ